MLKRLLQRRLKLFALVAAQEVEKLQLWLVANKVSLKGFIKGNDEVAERRGDLARLALTHYPDFHL